MYELHIANKNYSSWSLRPWVLLRGLNIPFAEQLWLFSSEGNHERFRGFSPTGRVPCLHDGATVVWDSLAIAEYLAERHVGVWSGDGAARAWARCASAEMHSGFTALRTVCSMNCGLRVRLREMPAALQDELARIDELWGEGLARFGGPFLAGAQFGAVDAFFAPVAFRVQTYALPLGQAAAAYAGRLLALPAMQAWFAAALAEPWRDAAHEAEVRQFGDVTADLRQPPEPQPG
jgi:glutathione S-transferase